MGCGGSQPAKKDGSGNGEKHGSDGKKSSARSGTENMRLLEEYSVGKTLGEGAYGVVSLCKKRSTGEEFAVKMVDKVETPVEAIKREADMLQSLDHQNIVKCHGVYFERCFVCIVMDKYGGGDVVEGLQRHLKERGQINCHDVVHVAVQMGAGIKYLHQRSIVHRDIKGDNYLMDRKEITDPATIIVLTDFGTACPIGANERLGAGVGTKIFWAPECFDRDYGTKVDVWAMGVIMYGLVSGRFPFRDENDIRTKEVKIPKRVHPVCEDFIKRMLDKVEKTRPSSEMIMQHQWVTSKQGIKKEEESKDSAGDHEDAGAQLVKDDANEGIKERRQELLYRMNLEADAKAGKDDKKGPQIIAADKKLIVPEKQNPGNSAIYEWWDMNRVKQGRLLDMEATAKPLVVSEEAAMGSDVKVFEQMLVDHSIEVKAFGTGEAKTIEQLASEVRGGAARLMLDATEHKKLVRVVDVVLLRVQAPPVAGKEPMLLIEVQECFPDGRNRETSRLPGTKKEPHENTRTTSERILKDFLGINPTGVQFDLTKVERYEEETESPSYPGVATVYRKELVDAVISLTEADELQKIGMPGHNPWFRVDPQGYTKFFAWMTSAEAGNKKVKLKSEGGEAAVSTLVMPPIGLSEEALKKQLQAVGIDPDKYNERENTKSLKAFSSELIKGEASLMTDKTGQLVRVCDVVLLVIRHGETNDILVQTEQVHNGKATRILRLPGAKRRPDENQFLSARRILRRQLMLDENQVRIETDVQFVEEVKTSPMYPGLKTVYRKRLIKAVLQQGK
mmetsp:Transcript_81499/g.174612  ORF Transcript_81499/g.174612 Transcript_81499/m.174612 type:complete len:789 (+) Transcript_81499:83-2449(+)